MSEIPTDLRYTEDHLWVRADSANNLARVGDNGLRARFPRERRRGNSTGARPNRNAEAGLRRDRATKAVSDLISPLDGKVHSRNDLLAKTPELVNTDPYGRGWMFELEVAPSMLSGQLANLMDAPAYSRLVGD